MNPPPSPTVAEVAPLDGRELRAIEHAVADRLQDRGLSPGPAELRGEVDRALERFRDARVRQYVSIFVAREVCASLEHDLRTPDVRAHATPRGYAR